MNRLRFLSLLAVAFLAACASGPAPAAEPPPPPEPEHVDPTGEWEIAVVVGGQAVDGVMTITGSAEEGYEAYVDTPVGAAAGLVEVDLDNVLITIPDAGVEIMAVMDAEEGVMEGEIGGGMGGGTFFASRISGG